jgi:hypothetical protein
MLEMEDCKSKDELLKMYEMKDEYEEKDIVEWIIERR